MPTGVSDEIIIWNKERYKNLWINSFTVIDLKDLKVYEGVAENPDSTMIGDEESIAKLIRKEMTFAEATAEVSPLLLVTWLRVQS